MRADYRRSIQRRNLRALDWSRLPRSRRRRRDWARRRGRLDPNRYSESKHRALRRRHCPRASTRGDGRAEATGYVEAEGLAERAELAGFIVIRPLVARTIRYEFHFYGDDGSRYRFAGEKTIRHLHPIRTWTTLPGALYDAEDRAIAHSLSHFDLKELGPFLRSFKLARV